jgi:hypothetical protein
VDRTKSNGIGIEYATFRAESLAGSPTTTDAFTIDGGHAVDDTDHSPWLHTAPEHSRRVSDVV